MLASALFLVAMVAPPVPPAPDFDPPAIPGFEDPFGRPTPPPVTAPPVPPPAPVDSPPPAVSVSGCVDVPGLGQVCAGQAQAQVQGDAHVQVRSAIHTLALTAEQRSDDVFSDYSKARNALIAIDAVATKATDDPLCRAIATTAEQTLGATAENWGPFDEKKVYSAVGTIAQLSQ